MVQGKVLSEAANRHVDIELTNGTRKRFQKNEFTSIDRDVPSTKDREMVGIDSRMYLGAMGGLTIWSASSLDAKSQFGYGLRFGANMTQLGNFSKFAAGLFLDHYSLAASNGIPAQNNTSVLAQFNFRKIANTGFYFGPELGLEIISATTSATVFAAGVNAGFEYLVNDSFSFGPDLHFDSHGSSSASASAIETKVFLSGTFHFE